MPDSYEVSVLTPCQGSQTVNKVNNTVYTGLTGDFSYVNLTYDGTSWTLTIYDYRGGSACYGVSRYEQVDADPDPVASQYGKLDSSGDPDTNLGIATVEAP